MYFRQPTWIEGGPSGLGAYQRYNTWIERGPGQARAVAVPRRLAAGGRPSSLRMAGPAGGLGLGPDDSCYDPQHPWFLPDWMHTAFECNCMVGQARPTEQLCVFAAPGGTPASYTAPAAVSSVLQIAGQTPGYMAGGIVGSLTKGVADSTGLDPTLVTVLGVGGLALLAVFALKR